MSAVIIAVSALLFAGLGLLLTRLFNPKAMEQKSIVVLIAIALALTGVLVGQNFQDPIMEMLDGEKSGTYSSSASSDSEDYSDLQGLEDQVDIFFDQNKFFSVLKKVDPVASADIRQQIISKSEAAWRRGEALNFGDAALVGTVVEKVLTKHMSTASNESVVAFTEEVVSMMKILRDVDPEVCLAYLFPEQFANVPMPLDMSYQFMPLLDVMAGVLESSYKNPQTPPDAQTADMMLEEMMVGMLPGLMDTYGEDPVIQAFNVMVDPSMMRSIDPDLICSVCIDLYEYILARPMNEKGPTLRYLFSSI